MAANDQHRVDANPTKAFFVNMITRDITLEDCIMDLIDNSVDAAWRSQGSPQMGLTDSVDLSEYLISIEISSERFSITDNCGGMTLPDAADHAFSFGRRESQIQEGYGIGVYGIGMKRAAFKLGTEIDVRSTYLDSGDVRRTFVVPIRVASWLQDQRTPWTFDTTTGEDLPETGVEVVIGSLTPDTSTTFESPKFIRRLARMIGRDYSLHLNRGLVIKINGTVVSTAVLQLLQGGEYAPARIEYNDKVGDDEVRVQIIGGMAAPPPESPDPDESVKGKELFGWHVACNGRIVLAADTTIVSGWGTTDWPDWHPQYAGFVGIVLFTAENARALPLTTTKRSVDLSSKIYLRARPRMREISKQWIAYTNRRKQALDEAKQREREEAASSVRLHDVTSRPAINLPRLVRVPQKRLANVNYAVPLSKMKKLAGGLGDLSMTYREVGLKSFDYTYEDLVGDE